MAGVILSGMDLQCIQTFVGSLLDPGIESALLLKLAPFAGAEILAEALRQAIDDLLDACGVIEGDPVVREPEGVVDAAVSLALVVDCARRDSVGTSFVFPLDVLPDDRLVQKCLEQYWRNAREQPTVSDNYVDVQEVVAEQESVDAPKNSWWHRFLYFCATGLHGF